jgi:hypothetical protein
MYFKLKLLNYFRVFWGSEREVLQYDNKHRGLNFELILSPDFDKRLINVVHDI